MEQEYDVNSPFDIEKHKKSWLNLEVMISPDGNIQYAVPSHQEFLINAACEKLGISRSTLISLTPNAYKSDYMRWLIMLCGYMPVWPNYIFSESPTHAQILALKSLKKAGLYRGAIPLYRRTRPALSSKPLGGDDMKDTYFSESDDNEILEILRDAEGQEIVCDHGIREAWFHSRDYSTELRILFLWRYRLAVSRVQLVSQRKGTMTRIFGVLKEFCEREGVEFLVVQSVLTAAMMNWCFKNGLVPAGNGSFELNGIIMGDYYMRLKTESAQEDGKSVERQDESIDQIE